MDKLKTLICGFIIIFVSTNCFSQHKNELAFLKEKLSKTKNDTTKISVLLKIVDLENNKKYLAQADSIALLSGSNAYRLKVLAAKSDFYKKNHLYDEFNTNNEVYLKFAEKVKADDHQIKALLNIATEQKRIGDYVESFEIFQKTLTKAQKINNNELIGRCYEGISTNFSRQKSLDEAVKYALLAKNYYIKTKNYSDIASINHLLGVCYHLKNDLGNAEKSYNESLKIAKANNYKIYEAINYSHLAFIVEKNDFKKKLDYQLLAETIFENEDKLNYNSIQNLGNLGQTYHLISVNDSLKKIANENTKSAKIKSKNYIIKAVDYSKEINDTDNYLLNLQRLSWIEYDEGNFKTAYDHFEIFYNLQNSTYSQENKNKIAKLESQKEIALRDKEIQLNKLTLKTKEREKWFYIGGILLLVIIGSLLYYQSRNRRKTNEKLQLLNAELDQANKNKTRFFSILNHDLRAPVANLIHFLHLQKENPELMDEATKNRMQNKTISGAENLLSSMEDILLWSKGQMENFKPQSKNIAVNQLFEDTKKIFSGYHNIKFEYHNPDNIEIFTDENYLKTIIRNLTSNAINAFTTTQKPMIIWKAWHENNQTFLSITDNGYGASLEQFKALYDDKEVIGIKSGLGLHLIRDLAKAIDCEISVDSKPNEGTTFTLKF